MGAVRLHWAMALALAGAGIAVYLFEGSTLAWWLGLASVFPFFVLMASHVNRKDDASHAGGGDGPWGPPPDGGGV